MVVEVDSLMIWMLESWTPLLQRQAQIGEVATLDDFGCIKNLIQICRNKLGNVASKLPGRFAKRMIQDCTRQYSVFYLKGRLRVGAIVKRL